MRKLSAIFLLVLICLPIAAFAGKKGKDDSPVMVKVLLKDGSRAEGELTTDWVRWPAKTINENFKIRTADGNQREILAVDVDSIWASDSKDAFTSVLTPVGRMFKVKNRCWVVRCGPKSENAEILSYITWVNITYGNRSRWEPHTTYLVRFGNDSIAYPFYYPKQNGDFNIRLMKKELKDSRPGAAEYIEAYFKKNKKLRKQLPDNPALLLEAYDMFLKGEPVAEVQQ
ncbi:MAG: hypothetical protein K2G30_08690 [Muribaculaceae bacterium]|nr:hypothetical protein [Muribaculaceae bacterium]